MEKLDFYIVVLQNKYTIQTTDKETVESWDIFNIYNMKNQFRVVLGRWGQYCEKKVWGQL